ncbi:MAG: hypothetical protein OEW00_06880 [candidate division Zixibacteria bacterium]|nr:hypothetical protein [candidate division Zixibacteria bacterium]
MRQVLSIIVLTAFLAAAPALASQVTNVELSYQEGTTVATIYVDGPIRFTHEAVEAKDGKPFRVLVDVLSATHHLGAKDFTDLPQCVVGGIRTSQYSVEPEKVVRLVFDMSRETIYRVDSDESCIRLSFADQGAQKYARWSAESVWAARKTSKSSAGSVANVNKSIESDRQLSLKGSPEAGRTVSGKDKTTQTAQVSVGGELYGPAFDNKWSEAEKGPEAAKPVPAPTQEASAKKPDAVRMKAAANQANQTSQPISAEGVKAKPVKNAVEPPPPTLADAGTTQKAAPAVKTTPATVKKAAAPTPEKTTVKVKKAAEPTPAVEKNTTKTKEVESEGKVEDKDESESKPQSTSRFRRSPTGPTKVKGTLVAEFPRRLVIKYKSGTYRDPFETLINEARTYNSPVEKRIPNVEGLKLVGIIESAGGENRALFEDKDNYGYILKAGDKVQKGYVLRVDSDRVYFQIFEYGWSRTVALNIEED